jgi:hypothetical protein
VPLSKTIIKQYHLFIGRRLEVVLAFGRNNAGLRKLSKVLSEQTSDFSFAFLNVICLLKHVLNCEQHFSFFVSRSGLSDIRINCNRTNEDLLFSEQFFSTGEAHPSDGTRRLAGWNMRPWRVVGLLTGHCHLKEHLFKLGLTDDPICEMCQEEDESATHIVCDCEVLKISSPGPVLHGANWLLWRPHIQGPTLHSRCGINKGLIKRGSTIQHWRSRCKGWILWPTPYTYIHTYMHTLHTYITCGALKIRTPTNE